MDSSYKGKGRREEIRAEPCLFKKHLYKKQQKKTSNIDKSAKIRQKQHLVRVTLFETCSSSSCKPPTTCNYQG